jgi:large subunit ribosomal protein L6
MSRIGLTPIIVEDSLTVTLATPNITVKGPKGELSMTVPKGIKVALDNKLLLVTRENDELQTKANHGLIRSLLNNICIGVSKGYVKKLEMVGTGYRVKKQGAGLVVSAGYSHPIEFNAPPGITLDTETETVIVVSGIDKQLVGETSAKLRAIRKPEPYKGKGIKYQGEVIRRKAGKATKAGA